MNTNDLKIFEAVGNHGSFTKAAEAMFTVQSNVTARIKSLEEEFGANLFTRTSRRVELTAAGQTLMRYCRQINMLIQEAKHEIHRADQIIGHLRIGCIETTMALKVPEIIHNFNNTYPDIELEFKSAVHTQLIQDMLNYKLDAAFIASPVNMVEFEQIRIKDEQLVILAASKHQKISDILEHQPLKTVVFDQGCVFRSRLEAWLGAKGIIQYKSTVVNSLEGIINFVEAGLGISILPAELINQYYSGRMLNTFALDKALGNMTTVLIYRNNIPPSKALQAFIESYR